jgi:membrane-associated phospholipid phosphatase
VNPVRPVDRLVFVYNVLLALVWGSLIGRADYAPLIALAHVAALSLPWLLRRGAGRFGAVTQTLHDIYPLLWMAGFWTELGYLHPFHGPTHDPWVTALDLAVFRVHWNAVWMPAMPWLWFSELMHLSYYAYYLVIVGPPLALLLTGRREGLRDVVLKVLVTYLGCFTLYLMFPVDGPAHTMVHYQGAPTTGFFYHLVHAAGDFGDSMGTAFPSSHVAGVVTAAWASWRWFSRPVALLLVLEAAGVVLATVYTQNHYAIDVTAGLLWAFLLQRTVVPLLERA